MNKPIAGYLLYDLVTDHLRLEAVARFAKTY